jgi:hypothetical protein
LVELARELHLRGVWTTVVSICAPDRADALFVFAVNIGPPVPYSPCRRLGRTLPVGSDGLAVCDLTETLPLRGRVAECIAIPGRTRIGVDPETGAEVCRVTQIGAGDATGAGWFYDDRTAGCAALGFSSGAVPPYGTTERLRCLSTTPESDPECTP